MDPPSIHAKPSSTTFFKLPPLGSPTLFKLFIAAATTYGVCRLTSDLNEIFQKRMFYGNTNQPCCPLRGSTKSIPVSTFDDTQTSQPSFDIDMEMDTELDGASETLTELLTTKTETCEDACTLGL